MSVVLRPLSQLLLRTIASHTLNSNRAISHHVVGSDPSWCRRRHSAIRRLNSSSSNGQEHASGDGDSNEELYLSDSCVKVYTLASLVFEI